MKVFDILEELEMMINTAPSVPLTTKIMLEKDDVLEIIDEIRNAIPSDSEEARKIKEHENRIIQQAEREAESILDQANARKAKLVDTNEITRNAQGEAEAIIKDATAEATRLKVKSLDYVNEMLSKTQEDMKVLISTLDANRAELKEIRKSLLPAKAQRQNNKE